MKKTLFTCETNCWNCNETIKIAYAICELYGHKLLYTPNEFSQKDIELAKNYDINIETIGYGPQSNPTVFKAIICPKCNKPFGNSHIKELVKNPRQELK